MARTKADEQRDGVDLTHLDQQIFDGAGATKRDLVDYLDAVRDRILPGLADRPLSVVRVRPGQQPFMQKNLPKYAPDWIPTDHDLGRRVQARGDATRCATTGAPCCGWPTSARSSTTRRCSAAGHRPRRPT